MADDIEDEIKQTRRRIDDTNAAMTAKLDMLEQRLRETIEKVKRSFDLRYQTDRYPWPMFGGSIAVGYLFGRMRRGGRPAPVGHVEPYSAPRLEQRTRRGVQDALRGEIATFKGLAVGAVMRTIYEIIRQGLFRRPSRGEQAIHRGRNGGPDEERRL